jgi:hypothetical protein
MLRNVGQTDRAIRLALGLLIIVLAIVFKSWLGLFAILPLATALLGYCPFYHLVKVSTAPKRVKYRR